MFYKESRHIFKVLDLPGSTAASPEAPSCGGGFICEALGMAGGGKFALNGIPTGARTPCMWGTPGFCGRINCGPLPPDALLGGSMDRVPIGCIIDIAGLGWLTECNGEGLRTDGGAVLKGELAPDGRESGGLNALARLPPTGKPIKNINHKTKNIFFICLHKIFSVF